MNTNRSEVLLLLKTEVFQIVGCAIDVLNTLGHGLLDFPKAKLHHQSYKGQKVGVFVPDLIVFDSVVVDAKVIERITDHERGLMLNYLRITGLRVGVVLNFKHPKLEWERIAL
jgi:PD-(D/E)XK nuclease superfamily